MTIAPARCRIVRTTLISGDVVSKLACLALLLLLAGTARAQTAQELYQRGLAAERAEGKLTEAIALYERAIRGAGANRALAARALLRLGAAYELLGRAEARAAYDRIVREYADQSELVAQARTRLAALEGGVAQAGSGRALRMREVWSGAMVSQLASPSPDGRLLATTDWDTGDLVSRDLRLGTTRRLTDKGSWEKSGAFCEFALFSPDGRQVAFSWFTDSGTYDLRLVSAEGGVAPRRVPLPTLDYVMPYAWMPSGTALLAAVQQRDSQPVLGVVSLDGRVARIAPINWRWITAAGVSPDGRWVVHDEANPETGLRDIGILAIDGTRAATLVSHAANDWHPMWTPDGSGVVFLSDRTGSPVLMIVDVADGAARAAPRVLKGDFGGAYPIGFAADGTFFYSPNPSTSEIMVADIDLDSARFPGTPVPATRSFVGRNILPAWSPAGNTLAFVSVRGTGTGLPGERTLVTVDTRTGIQRDFNSTLAYLMRVRWTPDGRSLILTGRRRTRDATGGMFLLDPATGSVVPHPAPKTFQIFEWAPDGRSMVYEKVVSNIGTLRRFTFEGERDELLYQGEGQLRIVSFAISPDGRAIAMTTVEHMGTPRHTSATRILSANGEVLRRLPEAQPGAGGYSSLNWSPDGLHLIGVTTRGTERAVWRVPVDGGPPVRFRFGPALASSPDGRMSQFRVSRDGKRAVFVTDDPNQPPPSIWVIEHLVPPAARYRSRQLRSGSSQRRFPATNSRATSSSSRSCFCRIFGSRTRTHG